MDDAELEKLECWELEGKSTVGSAAGGAATRRWLGVEGRVLECWEFGRKELECWEFEGNSAVGYAAGGATARRGLEWRGGVECWELEGRSWNGGSLEENPPLVMQP